MKKMNTKMKSVVMVLSAFVLCLNSGCNKGKSSKEVAETFVRAASEGNVSIYREFFPDASEKLSEVGEDEAAQKNWLVGVSRLWEFENLQFLSVEENLDDRSAVVKFKNVKRPGVIMKMTLKQAEGKWLVESFEKD